jgi:sterol desaturase/sphingolipid hydroxylase (fatty acid hydroxylase superfamily)
MKGPNSSDKRLRLFENGWLELLTVISVRWFAVIWAIVLSALAYAAWASTAPAAVIPLIAAGWLIFTLVEYVAHRFLFHWAAESNWMARIVFVIHGNHHIQPTDKLRSLMPPVVSFPIALAVWGALDLVFAVASGWMIFGFLLGYVAYDLTHYASHQWPMRGRLGQKFKRHHMLHHFASEHGNYAVTGLFWDRVFGTRVVIGKRRAADGQTDKMGQVQVIEPAE